MKKKFKQIVKRPTHKQGRSLDHVYIFKTENPLRFDTIIEGCYYSDHDKVITTVRKGEENGDKKEDGLARHSRVQDQGSHSQSQVNDCKRLRWSGRNDHGEGDGQAHQSQVQDQASCKRVRLSGRNGDGEGDSLASKSLVQEKGSHKAVKRSGRKADGEGLAIQSLIQNQGSCKRVRRSGRNGDEERNDLARQSHVQDQASHKAGRNSDGEGDDLARQLQVKDQDSHKAVRRSGRNVKQ